jgi:hypothetical protein
MKIGRVNFYFIFFQEKEAGTEGHSAVTLCFVFVGPGFQSGRWFSSAPSLKFSVVF